jgi:hypothetical protein
LWRLGLTDTLFMPGPLKNIRWERFAHAFVVGTPFAVAYEQAGFKPGPWSGPNGRKLARQPKVRQRIDELMTEAAERAIVGVGWIQHNLIDIIQGKAESRIRIDADGKPYGEIDRMGALVALARTLGIGDGPTVNVNATAAAASMSEVTDDQRIAAMSAFIEKHLSGQQPEPPPADPVSALVADWTPETLQEIARALGKVP